MSRDKQQTLFDTQPEPWQLDDQGDWLAARVALAEPPFGPYDYLVPGNLERRLAIGCRVRVPLGQRKLLGYCVDLIGPAHPLAREIQPQRLKPIAEVIDRSPIIASRMLPLAHWIADEYVCPLGAAIESIVPTSVREQAGTREFLFFSLADDWAERSSTMRLGAQQRRILEMFALSPEALTMKELCERAGCTPGPANALREKGLLVASRTRVIQRTHDIPTEQREQDLPLNDDQQRALEEIVSAVDARRPETLLMFGITGSGKTEVYIRAIQRVVEFGRQAIVLVPEISLTPQTRQRFRSRFDRVAVLHSHLTAAERAWHWNQIVEGRIDVVIGARSAVFAPVPRLGLIVIDEEHDGSFKQDQQPRYHAREVARRRTEDERVPLVLGSATPSLESYHRAVASVDRLLNLPRRVLDLPLPDVATIDMRADYSEKRKINPISQKLRQEIRYAIDHGGQVILLLNRRGFSTRVQCPGCREVLQCPDCSIALTYHKSDSKLICHYCDYETPEPEICPRCGFETIRFSGLGTQRLESYVQALFPDIPCARMDADTMKRPGSHEAALSKFRKGETKILLGTQMIAKGLDFPNVTLVGVINADSALHMPDFRAAERTFGLVTQVAGRSGRSARGGRVLVQTFSPDHPAIVAAAQHDFRAFAEYELPLRASAGFPPFGRLIRVVVKGDTPISAHDTCQGIAERIKKTLATSEITARILGPAKAPVERLRGKWRYHLLIVGRHDQSLQSVIRIATADLKCPEDVQWMVDVDAQDLQ